MTKKEIEQYQKIPLQQMVKILLKEGRFQEYMYSAHKIKVGSYKPRGGQPKADPTPETITYIYNKGGMSKHTALWLANNFYGVGDYKYGGADVGARVSSKYKF